jgi:two-component system sensor histidine kinase/response regulator
LESVDDAGELAALLEAFNNDGTFFIDVADMFITDYPPMVETLKKAIADERWRVVEPDGPLPEGDGPQFSESMRAADAARQLELVADQGRFETARDLSRRLSDELARFEQRLRRMVARVSEEGGLTSKD